MPRIVHVAGEEVTLSVRWFLILIAVIVFILVCAEVTFFGLSGLTLLALGLALFAAGHL